MVARSVCQNLCRFKKFIIFCFLKNKKRNYKPPITKWDFRWKFLCRMRSSTNACSSSLGGKQSSLSDVTHYKASSVGFEADVWKAQAGKNFSTTDSYKHSLCTPPNSVSETCFSVVKKPFNVLVKHKGNQILFLRNFTVIKTRNC